MASRRDGPGDGPQRTCVGCGGTRAQSELIRFGLVEGVLTPGRTLPGRGAYTCPLRSCFEQAVERGAFSRRLRARVTVQESTLIGLYTGESDG